MNDVLKKYKELLIQKRYSNNTQRIYCNYFKDFNSYFKDNDLDKLTTEQIKEKYMLLLLSHQIGGITTIGDTHKITDISLIYNEREFNTRRKTNEIRNYYLFK